MSKEMLRSFYASRASECEIEAATMDRLGCPNCASAERRRARCYRRLAR